MKINPVHWLLKKILAAQTAYPLAILFSALALAGLSLWYTAGHLEFKTSQKDLISPKERLVKLAERVNQFEELDAFVVVLESRDEAGALRFLQTLAPRLEKDKKNFREVFYRIDPAAFKPWALLYADRKDLLRLMEELREHRRFVAEMAKSPTLVNFFGQINEQMTSRMVGELFTGFLDPDQGEESKQPFDLEFLIRSLREMNRFLQGARSYSSPLDSWLSPQSPDEAQEGYFWSQDRRYLLLFATPTTREDFAGTRHALIALRETIAGVQKDFPGVKAGVTGPEALNMDQMGTALEDMSLATLLSIGGLAVLLLLFWRGWRRPLLEMTRLLIDLALTFGLTTLVVGHLNILSVTFAPLLLGLGIDYGVHWFARYMEEEEQGFSSKKEALRSIMERLGPGILLAGVSAALSFFPLVLTGFKGLMELGIICAMGLVVTSFTALTLLPALILLFDKPRPWALSSPGRAPVRPFIRLSRRRVAAILALGGAAFAFALWGAGQVRFDLNMLRLQSPLVESVVWEKKLLAGAGVSSTFGEVLAESLPEVNRKTQALESLPTVSRVESIQSLLPEDQEEKIVLLAQLRPATADWRPLRESAPPAPEPPELGKILGRIRFKMLETSAAQWGADKPLAAQMAEVRRLIDEAQGKIRSGGGTRARRDLEAFQKELAGDFREKLEILRANVHARPMGVEDLPPHLRKRFLSRDGHFLIRIFPREDIWEPRALDRFVADLKSVDADAIGDPVTLAVFTRAFRDACIKAALYAVAFIFLLLLFTFRDWRYTLLALVPLAAGTAWTLGLMRLFRVDLNLANSIFLPLVVGAGVEYAIIILHRWRQREKHRHEPVLPASTARGVILAGLTTTVGFGSLCISAHQGIFSLGLLTTVGSLAILAAAVLLLPAVLKFLWPSS